MRSLNQTYRPAPEGATHAGAPRFAFERVTLYAPEMCQIGPGNFVTVRLSIPIGASGDDAGRWLCSLATSRILANAATYQRERMNGISTQSFAVRGGCERHGHAVGGCRPG